MKLLRTVLTAVVLAVTVSSALKADGEIPFPFNTNREYIISDIRIMSDEEIDAESIARAMALKLGERYDPRAIEEAGRRALDAAPAGKTVRMDTDFDHAAGIVEITALVVDPPRGRMTVGEIKVTGAGKTDPRVIFTEIRVKTGDDYYKGLAKDIQKRVMNLRFFKAVRVTEQIDEAAAMVNFTIHLTERMTWGIVPIIDINGDDGEDHALGLRMEDNNAFGLGKRISRIWYQKEYSGYWLIEIKDPQLLFNDWTASLGVYTMWIDEVDYWDDVYGWYVSAGYRPTYETLVELEYNRRFDDYEDLDPASAWPGDVSTNSLALTLAYDDTAYDITAIYGLKAEITLERGMESLGSDYKFTKTEAQIQYGLAGFDKDWLLLRLAGGMGSDLDDVHDGHEYFTAGGTSSIRGYPPDYSVGDRYLVLSAQYEYPFWRPSFLAFSGVFSAAAFVDHGYAWLEDGNEDFGDAVTGAGAGLRVYVNEMQSVVLHLDYGYGFETEEFQPHFAFTGSF